MENKKMNWAEVEKDNTKEAKALQDNYSGFMKLLYEKYDAFLATQLIEMAKEQGCKVEDLCLCYDDFTQVIQPKNGVIRFWIEKKQK